MTPDEWNDLGIHICNVRLKCVTMCRIVRRRFPLNVPIRKSTNKIRECIELLRSYLGDMLLDSVPEPYFILKNGETKKVLNIFYCNHNIQDVGCDYIERRGKYRYAFEPQELEWFNSGLNEIKELFDRLKSYTFIKNKYLNLGIRHLDIVIDVDKNIFN